MQFVPKLLFYETYEQVQCDMHCDVDAREEEKWMSTERGPWCIIVLQAFRIVLTGARAGQMDDIMTCADGRFVVRVPCFFLW